MPTPRLEFSDATLDELLRAHRSPPADPGTVLVNRGYPAFKISLVVPAAPAPPVGSVS